MFGSDLLKYAKEVGIGNRFILTGHVPSEDLTLLYKSALSFVFPSKMEGFGLPGLEAMSFGCPVIASDINVFKEIYGDACLYFNPSSSKELSLKIQLLLRNNEIRTKLIEKGKKQVKKYSWRKMAEKTLKVYESV